MFQQIETWFDILNKNELYVSHQVDKILRTVKLLETSSNLQKQVDEYFEDDPKDIPEEKQ